MRRFSKKRQKINRDAQDWRDARELWPCERCRNQSRKRSVHEICRGIGNRWKALECGYATLVLCESATGIVGCHPTVQVWTETKQLALLYHVRHEEFNLAAYNALVSPMAPLRITQLEVDAEVDRLLGQEPLIRTEDFWM